jgi:AcrR family transcriptional regulator
MNRHHDETSASLLVAAHRLLAEDGPEALTVRRIASEAGMSTMNVYSRFGGKDGVIDELYADGYRRLEAALMAVPVTDDVVADLWKLAEAYRSFARDNPTYYRIMFRITVPGYDPSPEAVATALSSLSKFVSRVSDGQRQGRIVTYADGNDAQDIAAGLWAMCHGIVSLELDHVAEDFVHWETIFGTGMRTVIAGLHPSVAGTRLS